MRHPDVDFSRFKKIVYRVCYFMDPIINFFNHYYITTEEGFGMFSLRDCNQSKTGVNGHIEIYTGDDIMPKHIKTPIVRIVYDENKWNHYTSDYNRTIAVTISRRPRILQRHKLKKGEITKEQLNKFLRFISHNRDNLLLLWNEGWYHKSIHLDDPEHVFDWHLYDWSSYRKGDK